MAIRQIICTAVRLFCMAIMIAGIVSGIACDKKQDNLPQMQTAQVKRGDLMVTIPSDGIIEMPKQVELGFGTMGAVAEIFAEEGDFVHEGTLLARLDNTSQKNAIITALYDMQQARNTLEMSCSGGIDYIYAYPDVSATLIFEEAMSDLNVSRDYLQQGLHKEAASKLRLTFYELEICIDLLEAQLESIETYPLTPSITTYESRPDIPDKPQIFLKTQETKRWLLHDQNNLKNIHKLIASGDIQNALKELNSEMEHLQTSRQYVNTTIGQTSRNNITYPDTATSTDFLDSCKESIFDLIVKTENGDYEPIAFSETLRMAQLDLKIGIDTLTSSTIIYESGMNLQEVQQYNLSLLSAKLALLEAKNNLLKTEILAPFNGEIIDIGVEVDNVLSSIDYSSRPAVTLLDTTLAEFAGTIDEVDIFDVSVGQKAAIIIDAMPESILTGTVNFISPFGKNERGVVTFDMTAILDPADIDLRGGLTATADIMITSRENVLLMPSKALIKSPMGTIALVVTPGIEGGTPTPVTTGASDYEYTEVISGLTEGQTVLIIDENQLNNSSSSSGPPRMGPPPGGGGGPMR